MGALGAARYGAQATRRIHRTRARVFPDLAAWLSKWSGKYARLCTWVEENIEEMLTYYRLPLSYHKHMKSTGMKASLAL